MIEVSLDKVFIKNDIRHVLFKILYIIDKWKSLFPELSIRISKLMLAMSLLNKKTGHLFSQIKDGQRVFSIPSIEHQFVYICNHFIKKGVLIRPVNKKFNSDMEKVINLTKDLDY